MSKNEMSNEELIARVMGSVMRIAEQDESVALDIKRLSLTASVARSAMDLTSLPTHMALTLQETRDFMGSSLPAISMVAMTQAARLSEDMTTVMDTSAGWTLGFVTGFISSLSDEELDEFLAKINAFADKHDVDIDEEADQ